MNELTLMYLHKNSIGYGRFGVEMAAALAANGVDIYDGLPMPDEWRQRFAFEQDPDRREKVTNAICWLSVPNHARAWWSGQHTTCFTMWEAKRLPEAFRENLSCFDQIVVPSRQNVDLFSQFHSNVAYVPLGINPTRWHYQPRSEGIFFDFLIAGSGDRKGQDLAARAFRDCWPTENSWGNGRIPRLILKSPRGNDHCKGVSLAGDRIHTVSGYIGDADEVDLYATAACYLGPSRGEGFGLQPLQALAQGIPTILTNAHGQEAYAHLGIGISAAPSPAGTFMHGDAGDWWEPNYDELRDAMRRVYNNYDEELEYARLSAEAIARDWTWANSAMKLELTIGDAMRVPYSGSGEWVEPEQHLFPVILTGSHTFDIAGITYYFGRGEEQWVPADVKRILFEGGYLDPACISDNDPGLTPAQIAMSGRYSFTHSYCPTCHQLLNSKPVLADALEHA